MNSKQLLLALFALAWLAVGTQVVGGAEPSEPLATFAGVAKHGQHLLVPVRLGNWQILACLDTGSSLSALDKSLAKYAGRYVETVHFMSASSRGTTKLFESPPLFLGGIDIGRDGQIGLLDLDGVRSASDQDVRGIIGMSVLKKFALQIDFDEGRLKLFDAQHSRDDWGQSVPLVFSSANIPQVVLSVGGIEWFFKIDTGADKTCIDPLLLKRLKQRGFVTQVGRSRSRTLTGDSDESIYRLKKLRLWTFEHRDVLVTDARYCLLGLDYLSRYRVTFDFPHGRMYLKKGMEYQRRDNLDLSGLALFSAYGHVAVCAVMRGSAASEAGIKLGDDLVRIDGTPAQDMSDFKIERLFKSEAGRKIPIELIRSGKRIDVVLTLKSIPYVSEQVIER